MNQAVPRTQEQNAIKVAPGLFARHHGCDSQKFVRRSTGSQALKTISLWASVGFGVAAAWAVYFANANKAHRIEPLVYALARFTQPVAAVAEAYLNRHPVGLSWFLVVNAATYALLGL